MRGRRQGFIYHNLTVQANDAALDKIVRWKADIQIGEEEIMAHNNALV